VSYFSLFHCNLTRNTAQRALQAVVLSQLKGIERKASSIIFFNEPLPNLEEFHYPFSFPYDALKPFHELNMR
jgi:nitrate reductase beta subunit